MAEDWCRAIIEIAESLHHDDSAHVTASPTVVKDFGYERINFPWKYSMNGVKMSAVVPSNVVCISKSPIKKKAVSTVHPRLLAPLKCQELPKIPPTQTKKVFSESENFEYDYHGRIVPKGSAKPIVPEKETPVFDNPVTEGKSGVHFTGAIFDKTKSYLSKRLESAAKEQLRILPWKPAQLPYTTYCMDNNTFLLPSSVIVQTWPEYSSMQIGDVVLTIEICCQCECHSITLRHDEEQYLEHANRLKAAFISLAVRYGIRFAVVFHTIDCWESENPYFREGRGAPQEKRMPLPQGEVLSVDTSKRVGAFEVQLAVQMTKTKRLVHLLYSKLFHGYWPIAEDVISMVKHILEKDMNAHIVETPPSIEEVELKLQNSLGAVTYYDNIPVDRSFRVNEWSDRKFSAQTSFLILGQCINSGNNHQQPSRSTARRRTLTWSQMQRALPTDGGDEKIAELNPEFKAPLGSPMPEVAIESPVEKKRVSFANPQPVLQEASTSDSSESSSEVDVIEHITNTKPKFDSVEYDESIGVPAAMVETKFVNTEINPLVSEGSQNVALEDPVAVSAISSLTTAPMAETSPVIALPLLVEHVAVGTSSAVTESAPVTSPTPAVASPPVTVSTPVTSPTPAVTSPPVTVSTPVITSPTVTAEAVPSTSARTFESYDSNDFLDNNLEDFLFD